MNIYIFKWHTGEIDWVIAQTIAEAKEYYLLETGCGELETCTVKRMTKAELPNNYLLDINESEPDIDELEGEDLDNYNEEDYSCGYKIECTMEDYLKNYKSTSPCIVATSEF